MNLLMIKGIFREGISVWRLLSISLISVFLPVFDAPALANSGAILSDSLILSVPLNQSFIAVSGEAGVLYRTKRIETPTPAPGGGFEFDLAEVDAIEATREQVTESGLQTWMAWIQPVSAETPGALTATHPHTIAVGLQGSTEVGYLRLFDHQLDFGWKTEQGWVVARSSAKVPIGQWTHVCGRQNLFGPPSLFLNGVEVEILSWSGVAENRLGWDRFRIAALGSASMPRPFDGVIRDVRIYAGALSDAAISAIATEPAGWNPESYELEGLVVGLPLNQEEQAFGSLEGVRFVSSRVGAPERLDEGGYRFSIEQLQGIRVIPSVPLEMTGQTWMAWIRPDSLEMAGEFTNTHPHTVLMGLNQGRWAGYLRIFDGTIQFSRYNGTNWMGITTTDRISAGQWVHLCGRSDASGEHSIFINGRKIANQKTGGEYNPWAVDTLLAGFSGNHSTNMRPFHGIIRDARVYARALSDEEIAHAAALPTEFLTGKFLAPGCAIHYIPSWTRIYVGSPGLAVLPDGRYVSSHCLFGPSSPTTSKGKITRIYRSDDQGMNWYFVREVEGMLWASLFVHRDALYLMGVTIGYGSLVIRRSFDGGETWTEPINDRSGLLYFVARNTFPGYHTAPVPVVVHEGRIWRAYEDMYPTANWPRNFRAFVMSADVDADLLDVRSWTRTNVVAYNPQWTPAAWNAPRAGWLEGNVVVTPENKLVNILRVNSVPAYDKAAMARISEDGTTLTFNPQDPDGGFINFIGGMSKFTIRYDPQTKRYWSLINQVTNPENANQRSVLSLTSSTDLRHWEVSSVILRDEEDEANLVETAKTGFQYVDWLFEGDDLIAVSRTAYNNAANYHDANYLTFHRIENFRGDSPILSSWETY